MHIKNLIWICLCMSGLTHHALGQDATPTVADLITDLADDDVRNNAEKAIKAIMCFPVSPIPELVQALDSPDWQTRQIACDLLWNIRLTQEQAPYGTNDMYRTTRWSWRIKPGDPSWRRDDQPDISQRLIEVTLEGLRDDTTPYDRPRRRALMYTNAVHGLYRMIGVAHDWMPFLEQSIYNDDPQARYFTALIVARAGVAELIEPACAILLPQLRDNDIPEDAKYAAWALYGFGDALLPIIHRTLPTADDQQRDILTLLMLDITNPPKSEQEKQERGRKYNSITRIVHDPVLDPPKGHGWWWVDDICAE